MTVIYRMCGVASTNPSPIYQEDKYLLNELCLSSFTYAFSDIAPKVIFILDKCGVEYYDLVEQYPYEKEVKSTFYGINGTMLESYRLASELEGNVLFQECDYLYQKRPIGRLYEEAISTLGLVSPYDHPNFYIDRNLHKRECKIDLVEDHHFRTTERNTMTWGCPTEIVRENIDILNKYGYLDGDVWYELKDRGHELWVPIPSFATHMVADWLAPSINWEEIWQSIQ